MIQLYKEIDALYNEPICIKKQLASLYLRYTNDYITVSKFAADYFDNDEASALLAIKAGKAYLKHLNNLTK